MSPRFWNEDKRRYTRRINFKRRIMARELISFNLVTLILLASKVLAFGISHGLPRAVRPFYYSTPLKGSLDDGRDGDLEAKSGSGHIPSETIEEIKTYADIVTVIESYDLPLFSRSSDGYRAKCICPFHNDKNPSLNIDNERGIYKCFSCGAGGDVFNFVREFDFVASREKGAKMSYPAAIQKVAKEFCGGALAQKVQSTMYSGNYNRTMTPEKREKLEHRRRLKDRILLVNSAAADFYAKALITSPAAGVARAHLYDRGTTPAMVRTFALGFAPEAYFNKSGKSSRETWGKGSLVERLEELKFTPQEILDAGLATLTSKARSRLHMSSTGTSIMLESSQEKGAKSKQRTNNSDKSGKGDKSEIEYIDLMDRFRSRLIVPIFDLSGKNVIGFGGRHLEAPSLNSEDGSEKINSQSYVAAKYINTPETLVFSKKNVLFGLHSASTAIDEISKKEKSIQTESNPAMPSFQTNVPTLVIVEGYFDAITLYGAGIKEVVASMGTALTIEQLKLSASALGNRGRIILCLDNDEAGLHAVERVCAGKGIWKFLEDTGIEVKVASLPAGIKDPAEFIEAAGRGSNSCSGKEFRRDILGNAKPWNHWFISRLISEHDSNDSSSFSSVCENISNFLSTHRNAADRTKQAYEAAGKLAEYIAGGTGGSSEGPLRIQLESDLLGMASRKASARDALTKRIESADGENGSKETLAILSRGGIRDQTGSGLLEKSSIGDMSDDGKSSKIKQRKIFYESPPGRHMRRKGNNSYRHDTRENAYYNQERRAPPITQHFNGFSFGENDASWLGITNEKARKTFVLGEPEKRINRKRDLVYFNSNDYLGNERSFLSNIGDMNSTAPAVEGNINPLIKPDANQILLDAENRLLFTMVHYASARLAMKSALANRRGDDNKFLEWSSLEKEWLFHCLTDSPGHEHLPSELQDGGTSFQLKEHLRNRLDVPSGAFDSINVGKNGYDQERKSISNAPRDIIDINSLAVSSDGLIDGDENGVKAIDSEDRMRYDTQSLDGELIVEDNMPEYDSEEAKNPKLRGVLDEFFAEDEELVGLELREGSASHEERAELTIQETVAVMLKATAVKNLSRLKDEWESAITVQQRRRLIIPNVKPNPNEEVLKKTDRLNMYESLNDDQLDQVCTKLGQKVLEAVTTARELTESANQLNKRLLEYCAADGVEGRIDMKQREELAKALDEHLASLPDDPRPDTPGSHVDYIFGSDAFDSSIDAQFGGGSQNRSPPQPPATKKGCIKESIYESIFE